MNVTITVTAGPAKGRTFAFSQPDVFTFGRGADARVSLPDDPFLSRHHFMLEIAPPSCRVTDLDSKNGTFVNGVRYGGRKAPDPGVRVAPAGARSVTLNGGGEIVVGDTRMRIQVDTSDERTLLEPAVASPTILEPANDGATLLEPPPVQAQLPSAPPVVKRRTLFEDSPAAPKQSMPTLGLPIVRPVQPAAPRAVQCAECGKDVTAEAGARGQGGDVQYTCKACREAMAGKRTMMEAPAEKGQKPPQRFPGYRVEAVLGKGGMGVVYRAVQESTGRTVAIKSMLPQVAVSFQSYRTFHREIEVTRQLKHRNIVELLDHGSVKGAYYCVLEFVDGMDLKNLVITRGGVLALREFAPLMIQILDGLAHAHRAQVRVRGTGFIHDFGGVVHRDIKPENILLQRDGEKWIPKIADFGLAKSYESAGMSDMTIAGVCGTPIYWPREQITHYRYLHPATDVFSIASVFYEVLTGVWARPGLRETLAERLSRNLRAELADFMRVIITHPVRPIRELNPAIPNPVAVAIDRALQECEVPNDEKQMRDAVQKLRYADAGVFRDELIAAFKLCGIPY